MIALQQIVLKFSYDKHHLGETTWHEYVDRNDCFARMVFDRFRSLLDSDGDPIADNFRPTQVRTSEHISQTSRF